MMHQAAISGQCTMMMIMSQSQPLDSMSPMRKNILNNIGNSLNFKYLQLYKF